MLESLCFRPQAPALISDMRHMYEKITNNMCNLSGGHCATVVKHKNRSLPGGIIVKGAL